MPYVEWVPGTPIASPVYLDSGVLVAAFVRRDVRYAKATQLLGELLVAEAHILLSGLALSESLWMLAKLSYCEMFNQPSRAAWNAKIFQTHREAIFQRHGPRMFAIHEMVQDWKDAGISIDLVANGDLTALALSAPEYMRTLEMKSADAVHLAAAEGQAVTFVTTDSEFERAANGQMDIVWISPP